MVVKLKPTWDYANDKDGNDKTGLKRGAIGIDGAFDLDGREYMKTFDPTADRMMYGPTTNQKRVDGAMKVMTNAADPGGLKDTFKGSEGIDS